MTARQLVLDELRNVLSVQLHAADTLDDKLIKLFNLACLMQLGVVVFQLTVNQVSWFFLFACLSYVALFGIAVWAARPTDWRLPIPDTWEEISDRYFDEGDNEALEILIVTYLDATKANDMPLSRKARGMRAMSAVIAVVIVAFNYALWVSLV